MKEIVIIAALCLGACTPVCITMHTRCKGPQVQICDENRQWQRVMNCDEVESPFGEPWYCCECEDGHKCLPESECNNADTL